MTETVLAGAHTAPAAAPSSSPTHHTGSTPVTTEIVRAQPPAASLPDMIRYAEHLANAQLLPAQYRRQPANVLYAMEYGRTLGITPLAAINGIHVIEGKPSASAALISGLVRQAGHKLRVRVENGQGGLRAIATIHRSDDPDFEFRAEWDMERARSAGLVNKDVWRKYPQAMLKARAITEVARDACEEVLFGLHYTPEELNAQVDADGLPVDAQVQQLRPVQPGEPDPWATPGPDADGEFTPHPGAQALAKRAAEADSRDAVNAIADEARETVPADARVKAPDTGKPNALRDYLARRWKELPAPKGEQPGPTSSPQGSTNGSGTTAAAATGAATASPSPDEDEDIEDAEIVPDPEEDRNAAAAQAEAELRAFAAQVGIDDIDRDAEGAIGIPLSQATAAQIRGLLAQLRGLAA